MAELARSDCCFLISEIKPTRDRKSTRLNSSHSQISYAVFCLKKKKKQFAPSRVRLTLTVYPFNTLRHDRNCALYIHDKTLPAGRPHGSVQCKTDYVP